MITKVQNLFLEWALPEELTYALAQATVIMLTLLVAIFTNYVAKSFLLRGIRFFITKSKNTWDDIFLDKHVFDRLSHLAPAIVLYLMASTMFPHSPGAQTFVERLAQIYMLLMTCRVIDAFLSAVIEAYRRLEVSKHHPIQTYVQILKIIIYLLTGILLISIILNKSPVVLISGLGAMTAVILLVFKDTITGFVASIQLTTNKMVQRGDWIEMPKFGADGNVLEVTVNTVKVQNWDMTISTIPTYALVTDSFKNWRGMSESRGRRIKRNLFIDMSSIKFCDAELLGKLKNIHLLKDYLETKESEIAEHNSQLNGDLSSSVNGRQQTNIGIFRAYLQNYLKNHSLISDEMTLLVRQLQPGPQGLPIEIYVFSSDKDWINYEGIQSDLFDHILAILPEFELKVYQYPSGGDFSKLDKQ